MRQTLCFSSSSSCCYFCTWTKKSSLSIYNLQFIHLYIYIYIYVYKIAYIIHSIHQKDKTRSGCFGPTRHCLSWKMRHFRAGFMTSHKSGDIRISSRHLSVLLAACRYVYISERRQVFNSRNVAIYLYI
jgi:hypothetical protein